MKKIFFLLTVIAALSSFTIQKLESQDWRGAGSAGYECILDGNSGVKDGKGLLVLYAGGQCEILAADGRVRYGEAHSAYYQFDGTTLKITVIDNGDTLEATYVLIPQHFNGKQMYRSRWVSFFDNGKAMNATLFPALGLMRTDGVRVDGILTREY